MRSTNTLNLKSGKATIAVVAFHAPDEWWVHPKLPGVRSFKVSTEEEGCAQAMRQCRAWFYETANY